MKPLTENAIRKAMQEVYDLVGTRVFPIKVSPMVRRVIQAMVHDRNVANVLSAGGGPIEILGPAKPEGRNWNRVSLL